MLSHEHIKLLLQAIAVVLALHFAKGSMTGEYRNLMAVGLVVVVLMVVNHLLSEYEGADTTEKECQKMLWIMPMETKTEGLAYNVSLLSTLLTCCYMIYKLMEEC